MFSKEFLVLCFFFLETYEKGLLTLIGCFSTTTIFSSLGIKPFVRNLVESSHSRRWFSSQFAFVSLKPTKARQGYCAKIHYRV